jgi:hypothetical protein
MNDPTGIEKLVCEDIAKRQAVGIAKYRTTLADNPASRLERLQHAYEEALDMACYLKWEIERTKDERAEHHIVNANKMVQKCDWRQDDDGAYHSACGVSFEFIVDGPEANGFHYCHHCGKVITTIKESLSVPDDDGWIDHKPGDAMPCDGETSIEFVCRDGYCTTLLAKECDEKPSWWGIDCSGGDSIIKWRPAR